MSWLKQIFGDGGPSGPRHAHTFPEDLNATKCPTCGIPYSITTFAQQIKVAYPNPDHGEVLKINCSECNNVTSWVYRGEWDGCDDMKVPYRVLCVRIGEDAPSESEIINELQRLQYQYGDLTPLLAEMDPCECDALVGAVGFPNIDELIRRLQAEHFPQGVCCVGVNMIAGLLTMVNFPENGPPSIIPLDGQAGSHLAKLKTIVNRWSELTTQQLNRQDDIRHLLAGTSRHRRGLFLAGSPGWGGSLVDRTHRSDIAQSKNDASLDATLNDANAVFHLFHSLTEDDYLAGLVAGFLIRRKEPLMRMLQLIPFDPDAHGNADVLSPLIPEKGLITFDTKLFGSVMNEGRTTIIGGGGIGFSETVGERMHNSSECEGKSGQYALLYYSGHGSPQGNMQIEKNVAITPEELCEASRSSRVPYMIVLDMCFSSRFGRRYRELLRRHNWNGMVMCANDDDSADGLSFESTTLGWVRRPYWRFNILNPDWSKGRGLYTTAFTLAIQQLRECDILSKSPANISVDEFSEHMLRPICEGLATRFGLPLQKPTLFSNP